MPRFSAHVDMTVDALVNQDDTDNPEEVEDRIRESLKETLEDFFIHNDTTQPVVKLTVKIFPINVSKVL